MDYSVLMAEISRMSKMVELIPGLCAMTSTIQSDVAKIDIRLSSIETRMSSIEFKVSTMDARLYVVENDLATLKNNFIFNSKHHTKVQEITNEEFIFSYLSRKIPSSVFVKKQRFEFVNETGQKITELDGCILMNPPIRTASSQNARLSSFYLKDDSHLVSSRFLMQATILIESKRILNVPRMNTKIKQLIEITDIFDRLPSIHLSTTHVKFSDMVSKNGLNEFPKQVFMIFASNDISSELRDFIMDINNQTLDQSKYESHLCKCFQEDTFYIQLMKDSRISKPIKDKLKDYVSKCDINAITTACLASEYGGRSSNLLSYIPSYASMQSIYQHVKGKLGVLYAHDLIQPELIPMTNTLELVGGSRIRSTIKRRSKKY